MKRVSTEQTMDNIEKIISIFKQTPRELEKLSKELSSEQLRIPLASGKRSFIEDLSHLLNVEAVGTQPIYYALMINEPTLENIHPERDFGKLTKFIEMDLLELLNYFKFRRKMLINVLESLKPPKWAKTSIQVGRKNKDTVYRSAWGLAIHEYEHLEKIKERIESLK